MDRNLQEKVPERRQSQPRDESQPIPRTASPVQLEEDIADTDEKSLTPRGDASLGYSQSQSQKTAFDTLSSRRRTQRTHDQTMTSETLRHSNNPLPPLPPTTARGDDLNLIVNSPGHSRTGLEWIVPVQDQVCRLLSLCATLLTHTRVAASRTDFGRTTPAHT